MVIKQLAEILIDILRIRWYESFLELNHCLMGPILIWSIRRLCTQNYLLLQIWLKQLRIVGAEVILLLGVHLDAAFVNS